METVSVRMSRGDEGTAWGFRLQGGAEYNQPIVISMVVEGSLADRAGLRTGDVLGELCGRNARSISHQDAQGLILSARTDLDLQVQRTGSGSAEIWRGGMGGGGANVVTHSSSHSSRTTNVDGRVNHTESSTHSSGGGDAPPLPVSQPPPVSVSLRSSNQYNSRNAVSGYNVIPQPFNAAPYNSGRPQHVNAPRGGGGGLSPQPPPAPAHPPPQLSPRPMQPSPQPQHHQQQQHHHHQQQHHHEQNTQHGGQSTVFHAQYNDPAGLYSSKSAADTYLLQTGGLFGTDPALAKANEPPAAIANSATLKLIQETEGLGLRDRSPAPHGRGPPPPAIHTYTDPYASGRGETLHHSEAQQQSGSFKRLTTSLAHEDRSLQDTPVVQEQHRTLSVTTKSEGGGLMTNQGGHSPGSYHHHNPRCTTCGQDLGRGGGVSVGGKSYCNVHGAQHGDGGDLFKARAPIDPGTFTKTPGRLPNHRPRTPEAVPFYTPDILKGGPLSPMPTRAGGGISPRDRGVPAKFNAYGSSVNSASEFSSQRTTSKSSNFGGSSYAPVSAPFSAPAPPPVAAPPPSAPLDEGSRGDTIELSSGPPSPLPLIEESRRAACLPSDLPCSEAVENRVVTAKDYLKALRNRLEDDGGSDAMLQSLDTGIHSQILLPSQLERSDSFSWPPASRPVTKTSIYWKVPPQHLEPERRLKGPESQDYIDLVRFHRSRKVDAQGRPLPMREELRSCASAPKVGPNGAFREDPERRHKVNQFGLSYEPRSQQRFILEREYRIAQEMTTKTQPLSRVKSAREIPIPDLVAAAEKGDKAPSDTPVDTARAWLKSELSIPETDRPGVLVPVAETNYVASVASQLVADVCATAEQRVLLESKAASLPTFSSEAEAPPKPQRPPSTHPDPRLAAAQTSSLDRRALSSPTTTVILRSEDAFLGETFATRHSVTTSYSEGTSSQGPPAGRFDPFSFDERPASQEDLSALQPPAVRSTAESPRPPPGRAALLISGELETAMEREEGGSGGGGGFPSGGTTGGSSAPRRGKGVLKQLNDLPRIPVCETCHREIRGPFVLAMGKTWDPECFSCSNAQCGRKLMDIGFVEEAGQIYCEYCFEAYLAPQCAQCSRPVVGDCLNAIDRQWHPDCFACTSCRKPFGNSTFFLEDGKPYCEDDWNGMFTTKCISCQFPIEAGDRWVEALDAAYHSNCFTCTMCQKNLEGQSFYAKGGRPYCKAHA